MALVNGIKSQVKNIASHDAGTQRSATLLQNVMVSQVIAYVMSSER
jgi:hypothetical protein